MGAPRGAEDLALLLGNENVVSPFKDRALQTLLAPDVRKLPFSVTTDRNRRNFLARFHGNTALRGLLQGQEELAAQAAELIEQHIGELSKFPLFGSNREVVSDLYEYQFAILALLPVVPPEQAAKLFSHFRVNTPASWDIGSEIHSPYLLRALYHDPDIDEAYKRKGAAQIHKIIDTKPNTRSIGSSGNILATRYGEDLDILVLKKLRGAQLPVSRQFFQDEVTFLLGVDTGLPILNTWITTAETVQLLDDSQIKHKFLRRQFLPWNLDSSRTRIADVLTNAIAASRTLLTYFPEDTELTASIQSQLLKISEQERLKVGQPRNDLDAAIISRMSR